MTRVRILQGAGVVAAVSLVVAIVIGVTLAIAPRRPVEIYATHALGRPVRFGQVRLAVTPALRIELADIHVANAPWAAAVDLLSVRHVVATLAPRPLLTGQLVFRQLTVDGADLALERDPQGVGNWKQKDATPADPTAPAVVAARSRTGFPTIFELALTDSHILIRTTGGADLKIGLDQLTLQTADARQPVQLQAAGSYNDIPVEVAGQTES